MINEKNLKSRQVTRQGLLTDDFKTGKQNRVLKQDTGAETGFHAGQDLASPPCPV
jgi:hypothetical protein